MLYRKLSRVGKKKLASFHSSIERLKGTFGTVQLQWSVVGNLTSRLSPVAGLVTFGPGETNKLVQVLAVADGVPALEETFDLELSILPNTSFGANLVSGFEVAMVTIPDSNYPHGVFTIPPQNHTLLIALNVPTSNPGFGVLSIPVERTYGQFGTVQVSYMSSVMQRVCERGGREGGARREGGAGEGGWARGREGGQGAGRLTRTSWYCPQFFPKGHMGNL